MEGSVYKEVTRIENSRYMRVIVWFLTTAMLLVASLQYMQPVMAIEEEPVYIVRFIAEDGIKLDAEEVSTDAFQVPELTVEEGYELSCITSDAPIGNYEQGYEFSWEEVGALTGQDFTSDTELTLHATEIPSDVPNDADDIDAQAVSEEPQSEVATEEVEVPEDMPVVEHNTYDKLRANYVEIEGGLNLEDAEVTNTMPNVKLEYGYPGTSRSVKMHFFAYHGTVKYGKANRTATTDASTTRNPISGKLVLMWRNKAVMSDGSRGDVKVTVEDVYCNIGKRTSSKISDSDKVYLPIIGSNSSGKLRLLLNTPRTDISNNSGSSDYVTGATCQTRRKVTIQILKDGEALDRTKYPYMLLGFTDIDVEDHSIASGKDMATQYSGTYAEGVTLLDGWYSPVVLANSSSCNKAMQSMVTSRILDGHLNIKGDGEKYQELLEATGDGKDHDTYYGGFVAACNPAETSFYWYGSNGTAGNSTETLIANHPTVSVMGKRTTYDVDGNALDEDGGSMLRVTGAETKDDVSGNGKYVTKTYVMNSTVDYLITPNEGYYVKSVMVDGERVAFDKDGGVYRFERLNKNPLPDRDPKTGTILAASASSRYQIEVTFAKENLPKYRISKSADKSLVQIGDNSEIEYTININQTEGHAKSGTYTSVDNLAEGCLKIVPDSIKTEFTSDGTGAAEITEDGLAVTFNSAEVYLSSMKISYRAVVDWDRFEELYREASEGSSSSITRADALNGYITNVIGEESWKLQTIGNINLSKKVEGDLRDETKWFEMTVSLKNLKPGESYRCDLNSKAEMPDSDNKRYTADADGTAEVRFKIRGGGEATLYNLPYGTRYTVTEEVSDHVASYEVSGNGSKPVIASAAGKNEVNFKRLSTEEECLDAYDGEVSIKYTNAKNAIPITGIIDSINTYVIAGIGGLILLACMGLVIIL